MNECNSHIQIHTNWIHVQKKSSNWTVLHLYVYSLVHMSRYKMCYSHVKKRLHGISHRYLIFSTYSYIKQKVCVCVREKLADSHVTLVPFYKFRFTWQYYILHFMKAWFSPVTFCKVVVRGITRNNWSLALQPGATQNDSTQIWFIDDIW